MKIAYKPIDPKSSYKPDEFRKAFEEVKGLEGGLEALSKDNTNPKIITSLGEMLYGDASSPYSVHGQEPSVHLRLHGDIALKDGKPKAIEYVQNNSDKMYEGLSNDSKLALVVNTDPVKGSKNEKYDEFVKVNGEIRKLQEISKDPRKMSEYVLSKLSEAPEWFQQVFSIYAGNAEYVSMWFQSYASEAQNKIGKFMKDLTEEDIDQFGKIILQKAKSKKDKKVFEVLGELAYQQMSKK